MYISLLERNKKSRISLLFKRKVVESYRAGLVSPEEFEQSLSISKTELRRLNRWYFKHKLSRYTYPSNFRRIMKKKTDMEYLRALEKRLQDTEKENKMLRLKAEAYEIVIEIAEEHGAARAVQHSDPKKAWSQATERLTRRYPLVGMGQLCGLFGLTRQAWYAAARRQEKKCFQEDLILSEVRRLRKQIPGLGTAKLHEMLHGFLSGHRIKLGRDKLHNLLKERGLLVKRKGIRIRTTDSDHCYRKYPNRVKNLIPERPNELWVSDLTYFPLGSHFAYLTVVMDAYSRKIVGWSLQKTLEAKGSLQALDMALVQRGKCGRSLVHHSDRGVQYCSWMYVNRLRNAQIGISMTESGDPNENAMAERVFRTLKEDFQLRGFTNFERAMAAVAQAIQAYNSLRPHASLGYMTPDQAHKKRGRFELKWYPYKKVRYGNVQYATENQPPPQPVNSFQ